MHGQDVIKLIAPGNGSDVLDGWSPYTRTAFQLIGMGERTVLPLVVIDKRVLMASRKRYSAVCPCREGAQLVSAGRLVRYPGLLARELLARDSSWHRDTLSCTLEDGAPSPPR